MCEQIPLTTKDELIKAFKKIDINGDGFITNDELFKVMTTVSLYTLVLLVFLLVKRYSCKNTTDIFKLSLQ